MFCTISHTIFESTCAHRIPSNTSTQRTKPTPFSQVEQFSLFLHHHHNRTVFVVLMLTTGKKMNIQQSLTLHVQRVHSHGAYHIHQTEDDYYFYYDNNFRNFFCGFCIFFKFMAPPAGYEIQRLNGHRMYQQF